MNFNVIIVFVNKYANLQNTTLRHKLLKLSNSFDLLLKYDRLLENERDKWIDMIQKIVDVLVNKQIKKHIIAYEDDKIYRYGYILLCEVFLNLVIALIIGIVFSRTREVFFS